MRLKSNEDLHKLWYVLLKEKNMVETNKLRLRKSRGTAPRSAKLNKVKQSMARLLTVMSERKKLRETYRRRLEDEYVEKKRQEELEKIQSRLL